MLRFNQQIIAIFHAGNQASCTCYETSFSSSLFPTFCGPHRPFSQNCPQCWWGQSVDVEPVAVAGSSLIEPPLAKTGQQTGSNCCMKYTPRALPHPTSSDNIHWTWEESN